jgi:hypothetical protein
MILFDLTDRKTDGMKRPRKHPLFLLAIASAMPLGIAFLYYDFYDDHDLVWHQQFSMADKEDLLSILRKNSKAFVVADEPLQPASINLFEIRCFHSSNPVSAPQTSPVLRC